MNINWHSRELNLKIVYYGPAMSGKTTNLEKIYERVAPTRRSEMVSLKTHEDRTLFFDFFQVELGKIGGLTPKISLYTVPGQTYYEASRKLVLRGADGVVFVADSAPARMQANQASWQDLSHHLESYGLSIEQIPVIIQCNKQDLPGAVSTVIIQKLLQTNGRPILPATAARGEGVSDTFRAITMNVMSCVQQQIR
ncbi:MAG TPA: GTPase domain-containing protein [Anaerolineaceae bacterium]|nr:GTPase domain-containing protein [Anaerolineaceae bacterium]